MEDRKPFVANKNHFYVFFGLFLCLLSVILCLNTGIVARVISTPFTFALGAFSYIFYLAINALGLRFIFVRKGLKIRLNNIFFATFILLVSLMIFYAHFASAMFYQDNGMYVALSDNATLNTESYITFYNNVFNNVEDGYYQAQSLSLFSYPFAAGYAGYFLLGLLNNLFNMNVGGLFVAIGLAVLAILLYFTPFIIKAMRQKKINKKNASKEVKGTVSDIAAVANKKTIIKVKNIDVVKGASKIDPDHYESEIMGVPTRHATISSPTFIQEGSDAYNFTIAQNGVFTQAKFLVDMGQRSQNVQASFKDGLKEDEGADVAISPTLSDPKTEQLHLDFEGNPSTELKEQSKPARSLASETRPVGQGPAIFSMSGNKPVPSASASPTPSVVTSKKIVEWVPPNPDILATYETAMQEEANRQIAEERKVLINNTFSDFGVGARVEDFTIGPSITRFNIRYDHNVSARSVSSMVQDIQIRLSGVNARFESIVEGQSTSGLEIPNAQSTIVSFKSVFEDLPDPKSHPLAVAFGKNIKGDVIAADFDEFPHLLIAGSTGSGKSIFVNSLIVTLIMRNSPDDLKIVLVDPKKVEMARFKDMPHLLCPIVTDAVEAKYLIEQLCQEMEDRYVLFADNGVTNIKEFNEDAPGLGLAKLPYIIVVLDEYADLVDQCKEISMPVVSLAQKARACGIHLMISTQRPSTNVVTGVIKANLPTHVALMTASSVDSMTIIGEGGAEKLIGKGDMLVQSPLVSRVGVVRLQGCFIHRNEISRVVGYLKEHYPTNYDEKFLNLTDKAEQSSNSGGDYAGGPEFKDTSNAEEDRYQAVKEWVMTQEYMSISRIQRECAVGFNRAGRFFLRLQSEGIVANETESNRGCKVLVQDKFSRSGGDVVTSDELTTFRRNS